jgi:hypothetical protein
MTYSVSPPAVRRHRRWPWFLPFALLVLLAIGWTGVWFYAAERAKAEIAAWRQREFEAGRMQDCASEQIGGFPFRIEVSCGAASFELKGNPSLQLKLPRVEAAVQVYDPKLLIAEFSGPLDISEPNRPPIYVANWSLGQASVRGLPGRIERASLVLEAPTLRDPRQLGNGTIFRAQHLELHGREAAGSTREHPAIDTVLRISGAVAEGLHPLLAKPIDGEVAAVVHGLPDLMPKPWPTLFKEWQSRDGEVEIVKARVTQDEVIAVGAGTLKLTPQGRLDGNLQVTVVGIEKVLKALDIERFMSEGQVGATINALDRLIPGLGGIARQNAAPGLVAALGQRTVLDGKPAVAFPIRFADGAVFLGPFQVAQLAPLFTAP